MKPHISINPKNHKWAVWHDRSDYPRGLPAIHGESPTDVYGWYCIYKGLNHTPTHHVKGSVPVVISEGAFWVIREDE